MMWITKSALDTKPTISSGARIISIRKKPKWIDRRRKTLPHLGKEVWNFGEQPSCELCHVRFRFKQDYQAHAETELHKSRLRWVEMEKWWSEVGQRALRAHEDAEWAWFKNAVVLPEVERTGRSEEEVTAQYRHAVIRESPESHCFIEAPAVRHEVSEPRDNRWPSAVKW